MPKQKTSDKEPEDLPWFRRFRPDGRMEPVATRGNNGQILILDEGWAASFKEGAWHEGILYSHEQLAEFAPVGDRDEVYRLLDEARFALGVADEN